jgi:hypothetical protein
VTDSDADFCTICGKQIVPFGTFSHRFIVEDLGAICTDCARQRVPSKVALAEEMDRRLGEPKSDKEKPR